MVNLKVRKKYSKRIEMLTAEHLWDIANEMFDELSFNLDIPIKTGNHPKFQTLHFSQIKI